MQHLAYVASIAHVPRSGMTSPAPSKHGLDLSRPHSSNCVPSPAPDKELSGRSTKRLGLQRLGQLRLRLTNLGLSPFLAHQKREVAHIGEVVAGRGKLGVTDILVRSSEGRKGHITGRLVETGPYPRLVWIAVKAVELSERVFSDITSEAASQPNV